MTNAVSDWSTEMSAMVHETSFTLAHLWDDAVQRYGSRQAVDFLGRKWTFGELDSEVCGAAGGLQEMGVRPGDRVALCLPNTPYYVVLYFAILKIGAIVVNLNPLYTRVELEKLVQDSGAAVIAVPDIPDVIGNVEGMVTSGAIRNVIVCPLAAVMPPLTSLGYRMLRGKDQAAVPSGDAYLVYRALVSRAPAPSSTHAQRGDAAVFQYTGGTTGLPKAAILTHGNLLSNCWQTATFSGSDPAELQRVVGVLPLFHVFALTTVLNTSVLLGSEMILLPRFEQKQFTKTIARSAPTRLFGVPTLFQALVSLSEKDFPDFDSLQLCVSGGAALPEPLRKAFEARTGCRLVEGYGLSETAPIVTCNPIDGTGKSGSAGHAYPDTSIEIRGVEPPHLLLPTGETGEVCIRGPQVMKGYWNREEENRQIFVDGALRTGDVGYVDADGFLFLVDRIKDVIICGGYNVYPRVIEDALYEHASVEEVIVIGMPDAYRGESPRAYVVLKEGSEVGPAELFAHLKPRLSKIEMPKEIEFRVSLPKTKIGKLSKADLKKEVLGDQPASALN